MEIKTQQKDSEILKQKATELFELRKDIEKITEMADTLKIKKDNLQQEIIKMMNDMGFNSIKTNKATISKVITKKLIIKNEKKLIEDLKNRGLQNYVHEKVDSVLWRSFGKEARKQNFEGTECVETEHISVRNIKK